MTVTEGLYKYGASGIKTLQNTFPNSDNFFFTVTQVSDPLYAFTILFPLAASLNTTLAADILVVSILAEWSNTLLKWLLMEDRPYWWVREMAFLEKPSLTNVPPPLRQTHLTCETGPGSPSGHVMGATAVAYVVVQWCIERFVVNNSRLSNGQKKNVIRFLWLLFVLAMVFVALSRLYVATHFPHQCFLGFFCGLGVGWLFTSKQSSVTRWWQDGSRPKLLLASLLMSSISVGAYWLQKALGIDPQWSVRMAFKWCDSPDYIHVNTTPLFSLVRDAGAVFGVALASPVSRFRKPQSYLVGIGCCFLLAVAFRMATDAIPTKDVHVFYGCQFMLFATEAFLLLIIPQKLAAWYTGQKNRTVYWTCWTTEWQD
ncbi:glucose-6-phosphatase catalytic subunit 1 [Anabrus simplex]|uniref:glucose-6-phosphatase catalytic subunit 1 n=1 Tax=Anabrus simplex TaxID=316456 RepID=UPI0035A30372